MQLNLDLNQQIQEMGHGDHVCLIYKNEKDQMDAIVPFMRQGLERDELCVYIVDDRTVEEVKHALNIGGIDVEGEVQRGALVFATKRDAYLYSGEFEPHGMMVFLRHELEAAVSKGFAGFRVTGEMTWALGEECGCHKFIEYEALLNEFFPGSKATAICQYNANRFSPEMIRDVLRTHPIAILDGNVCSNLFYESPRMVMGLESPQERVDWMMGQLKNYRKTHVRLIEAVKSRDEFLTIASHELKTPLTSLKLQAQGMNKMLKLGDHVDMGRISKVMETTERQVERLSKLVDDLLDVSQINAGRLRIKPEVVNLCELTQGVVERFSSVARKSGVVISTHTDNDVVGEWDKFRLEQVLSNLLTNSLKYGNGQPVEIDVTEKNAKAYLSVKDNGIGISEEDQPKIFDRFTRAIHANEVSGMGLGLYISREIVESHSGKLNVKSAPGRGTTFILELPLHPFKAAEVGFSSQI